MRWRPVREAIMLDIYRANLLPIILPMLARPVSAGFPSPADDFIEDEIDLSRILVSNRPATFFVRVRGDSMIEAQMFDGDIAVVDRSLIPQGGDVVVVDVDGERSFKVWRADPDGPRLAFANASYPLFDMSSDAVVEVWGVVSGAVSPGRRAGVRRTVS